ncbi:hypothetical protein OIO90_005902 [Microbotryomycetes sp. JL221]|nr:hypothetical protein OIO90_005902 [Microbotryomycetes sp. JL221]
MDEIRKVPPVTRTIIGGVLSVTLPVLLHLVSLYPFIFVPHLVTRKFQLWRLATGFLFGGKGIGFVFDLFLMGRGLWDLEENHFRMRTADFAWALTLISGAILWAQVNSGNRVSLFGMINLPAPYFPFALILLDVLQAGPQLAMQAFTGIIAAHAFVFASIIYPRQNANQPLSLISTPQLYISLLGNGINSNPNGWNTTGQGRTIGSNSNYLNSIKIGFKNLLSNLGLGQKNSTGSTSQRLGSSEEEVRRRAMAATARVRQQQQQQQQKNLNSNEKKASNETTTTDSTSATTSARSDDRVNQVGHRWGHGNTLGSE